MKPEEQRIAIAEACGWREAFPKAAEPHPETRRGGILLPYQWVNENTHERRMELPDYLNDLNAMHEAEKIDAIKQNISLYAGNLEFVVWRDSKTVVAEDHPIIARFCIFATAAQRAEAFLRTLNLWRE